MKWRGNIYGCDLDLPNNAETCGFQAKNKKVTFVNAPSPFMRGDY